MRLVRLDLRNFGPFQDAPPVEFGESGRGLHLIVGPNEAGKSTALRAIRHLLFGFPKSTEDHHGRGYDALRVGATVRGEDGTELSFLRRKRDVKPLWTPDDASHLPSDALAPFLGGLEESEFNDFFGMDHEELVAGGRSILGGGGRLGEILFSAGSGIARVDEVRRALDAEMEALFKPRGELPAINAALAELKQARAAADRAMLGTEEWVALDGQLALAKARLKEVDADWRRLDADSRRLAQLRTALPVIARRDSVARELAEMGDAPILADGFADRRHRATVDRALAARSADDAAGAIEEIGRDLDALGPPDAMLWAEADAIRRVRDDLAVYRQAIEARPDDLALLADREAEARALLVELKPGSGLDDLESFQVPAARRAAIQALAQEAGLIGDRVVKAEAELARLLKAHPSADGPPLAADAPGRAEDLASALERAQARGDLEGQLADARADWDRDAGQAEVDARALPLWSGTLDELEALAVPSSATIDRAEAALREVDEAVARIEADRARAEADRAVLDREIDRADRVGAVPTEEDLSDRRRARDEGWRRIRLAWIDGEPTPDPSHLALGFEADVRAADEASDRLRREADRVAERAHREMRRREAVDRLSALGADLIRAEAARESARLDWIGRWRGTGIEPLSPREMKDWVIGARADLARRAQALRDRRASIDRRSSEIEAIKAELGRHLGQLGEPGAGPSDSMAGLLARGKAAVDRVASALGLVAARDELARAESGRDAWRVRWASAVGPMGLAADALPAEAIAALDRLDELAIAARDVRALRARVADRSRLIDRYEADVSTLVERLGLGSIPATIEGSAVALAGRLDREQVAEAGRESARKRMAVEQIKLAEARSATDRADLELSALVAEARCGSADDLIEAERASDEARALRLTLWGLDDQLATLAGPVPVASFRREAEGLDPSALDDQLAALADRLPTLEADRGRLGEEIGRCLQRLDSEMAGGPIAADARQEIEARVARLAADVDRYARLRLASAVLRDAVERHRQKNQGRVLDRAGDLFKALTAGSFGGLRADSDDKGRPVLLGRRGDGSGEIGVAAMSEGTADQLYLALRLASLEAYLDDHEPMPVVLDDVLIQCDDARALAALRALADLSRRTQVLFFTHHDHLATLAQSAIPESALTVHRLTYPPTRVARSAEADTPPPPKPGRKRKAATAAEGD